MLIYHAYLDYGPHEGERSLGYFHTIGSAIKAIRDSANHPEYPSVLGRPWQSVYRRITWPIIDPLAVGFPHETESYVIETIEVLQ